MAEYKKQTGISFIIAEKEDGTYDVNMGSNADLPQDGLPVKLYTGIMQAVCDCVEARNMKTCSCSDSKLIQAFESTRRAAQELLHGGQSTPTIERMLAVIKKIAQTKQEVNKASNQIAAYEIGQQMGKLIDELVSLYAEMEQK